MCHKIKINIILLIKTGFQIIANNLSYNMKSLTSMSVSHSETYVTFCHKLHFKCICGAKVSFCGYVPLYNFVNHDFFYISLMSKKIFETC